MRNIIQHHSKQLSVKQPIFQVNKCVPYISDSYIYELENSYKIQKITYNQIQLNYIKCKYII